MRQKTDSITHLVKIVAREVFDDLIDERLNTIDKETLIEEVISSCSRAGLPWTTGEDNLLRNELKAAIGQIATNHNRSINSILHRTAQRGLI